VATIHHHHWRYNMADPNFQRLPAETKDRFRQMIEMDRREKEEKKRKKREKEMERKRKKAERRQKNEDRRKKIADILYGGNK